jgi:hypothetical protein
MTAEQKIRETLSRNQHPFQHEGDYVVRWITGGTAPDIHVTFQTHGGHTIAHCPLCNQPIGRFDAHYGSATYRQLAAIREVGNRHQCQR